MNITQLVGQNCSLVLQGEVIDEYTASPLQDVNVIIHELSKIAVTTGDGNFKFENLCQGHYHILISHIGCEPREFHLDLDRDTIIKLQLAHSPINVQTVTITNELSKDNEFTSVGKQIIEDNMQLSLADLLDGEVGVSVLKTGSNVSKPIIQGLFGNRITILNNDLAQAGQTWGNDHSPEIDPLMAGKISLIKGAKVLQYGGGTLGSIILMKPPKIGTDPHLHGTIGYAFESNGQGQNLNFQLQKYQKSLSWRLTSTFKDYGDKKSPDYFLRNTGFNELNLSLQLEKYIGKTLYMDFFLSTYNTTLGILRGSHISNTTNLELAINQKTPYFTEPKFNRSIDAPKQEVNHHLAKYTFKYYPDDKQMFQVILGAQLNQRAEFDIRRGGRTTTPSLNLRQYSFHGDAKYNISINDKLNFTLGNQSIILDNTNNPETGILPLIPDYFSFKNGNYFLWKLLRHKLSYELGIRYDYVNQKVAAISTTIPRMIERYDNHFHNLSAAFGLNFTLFSSQELSFNLSAYARNPEINELYSNGLHQGISAIELGKSDLTSERSYKATLEHKYFLGSRLSLDTEVYYQNVSDYIILAPQDDFRLTIRGAFPLFQYEQTNASLYGIDTKLQFSITNSFLSELKYSTVTGTDLTNDIPLIYVPPAQLNCGVTYRLGNYSFNSKNYLEDAEVGIEYNYTFKQTNLLASQDFIPAPEAYGLFNFRLSSNLISPKMRMRINLTIVNLFDIRYRNYLNRQRYFADESGRSLNLGVNFKF